MRLGARADDPFELLGLTLGLAPLPAGHAMYGMPAARTVSVAQRTGLFAALAERPRSAEEVASTLELAPVPTRLVLDCLRAGGHLDRDRDGCYRLSRRARRWLDPQSPTYLGTFLDHTADYWEYYAGLEPIMRGGESFRIHEADPTDESWRRYIVGQYELARLSAVEVARRIRLRGHPRSLLDVAGGHGLFAAELCRRHEHLEATVIDLPASAAVGRDLMRAEGMDARVRHIDGDMFEADLLGPHDGALCFDILHHLSADEALRLLERVRGSLREGATIAILDMFRSRRPRASAAYLGLFFHLTSGADLISDGLMTELLSRSGFARIRRTRVRRIPDQRLYQATAV